MFDKKKDTKPIEVTYNMRNIKPNDEEFIAMSNLIGTKAFDTFKVMIQYYSDAQRIASSEHLSMGKFDAAKAFIDKSNAAVEFLNMLEENIPKKVVKILEERSKNKSKDNSADDK